MCNYTQQYSSQKTKNAQFHGIPAFHEMGKALCYCFVSFIIIFAKSVKINHKLEHIHKKEQKNHLEFFF